LTTANFQGDPFLQFGADFRHRGDIFRQAGPSVVVEELDQQDSDFRGLAEKPSKVGASFRRFEKPI
jgi:hypothetical protein